MKLPEIANKIHEHMKDVEKSVKQHFLELGNLLNEAKNICFKHKIYFNKWVKENLELSQRHCERLIKVYSYSLTNPEVKQLSFRKAYDTILKSDEKRHVSVVQYKAPDETDKIEITRKEIQEKEDKLSALEGDNIVLKREVKELEGQGQQEGPSVVDTKKESYSKMVDQLIDILEGSEKCNTCNSILAVLNNTNI